ncbi:NmrA family transcriptional regulator, partial [Streptomyces sp. SID2119]|nr:NmrA family transcriptional regulator [Streptomyces sp. SID2119]
MTKNTADETKKTYTKQGAADSAAREGARVMGTVLVTSGTGKTGRRVGERLAALGVPVRAGSRAGGVPFDWQDESGWAAALDGAEAAYVAYYPDLAVPGATGAMAAFGR